MKNISLLLVFFLFGCCTLVFGQRNVQQLPDGNLEMEGLTRKNGEGLANVNITVKDNLGNEKKYRSSEKGEFRFSIPLGKEYEVKFEKAGFFVRRIEVSTVVPESEKYILYSYKFNIDLFEEGSGMPEELLSKSAAKFKYDETIQDFEYDKPYSKKLVSEIKAFKDSLVIAKASTKEEEKKVNDSLLLSKLRADSLQNAARIKDSIQLAETKKKAKLDSLNRSKADSIFLAEKRKKAIQDSILKSQNEMLAREAQHKKHVEDSIMLAKIDSASKAESRRKIIQDSLAKNTELQNKIAAMNKLRSDSIAKAKSDSILIAKKETEKSADKEKKYAPNISLPKVNKEYPDGITEETIKEQKRTIERIIVKRNGIQNVLDKVVYDWGGIFYFKDENSISESSFEAEHRNAKANKTR